MRSELDENLKEAIKSQEKQRVATLRLINAAIKDTFVKTAEENGHKVDCVDLYKEKFDPVFAG